MLRPAFRGCLAIGLVSLVAGCQDYNFNPVGKCLIQPATERFTLSDVSSADVLFVVDESGSMAGEQQALADNFGAFIDNLNAYNEARVSNSLEPFDFHIAVTTTSVMWNPWGGAQASCRNDCAGNVGSNVCCTNGQPLTQPRRCTGPTDNTCGAGFTCQNDCNRLKGEYFCCDAGNVPLIDQVVPCTRLGAQCGELETHYDFSGSCSPGVAADEWPFAQGSFVSLDPDGTGAGAADPRVLHFDKVLYTGGANRQGFDQAELEAFFRNSARVGTCGSGEEMALLAARMAVEKALAGQQKDTRNLAGGDTWDDQNRVASSDAEWPHPGAKLVLVFVGDEDDCSSPVNAAEGVVWLPEPAGADACVRDATLPEGERRQFPVGDFVNYFMGLGRPVAAAFVISTEQDACGRSGTSACTPGICCGPCGGTCSSTCGAQAAGFRLYDAAQGLRSQGAEVFAGSICDGQFNLVLDEIANVVKPPSGLVLPTEPAESVVTLLRIADGNGQTRKICRGPAPVGTPSGELGGWDWWFTVNRDANPRDPVSVSRYVYINPDATCQANPGETYSADYIGLLPPGGCQNRAQCQATLGGRVEDWGCHVPPGLTRGTCICCEQGSTDPACQ